MRVNLVISRHEHGALGGGRRQNLGLTPEGAAALERLANGVSKSAVADLAVRILDVLAGGDTEQLEAIGRELAGTVAGNDGLVWLARGLTLIAEELEAAVVLPPPWDEP